MFTQLKNYSTKLALFLLLGVTLLVGMAAGITTVQVAEASESARAAAAVCVLDQQNWVPDNGAANFGGATTRSQTFRPTINGPVCKVQVRIRRNTTAGAGVIKLTVRTQNGAQLDAASIDAPPVGVSEPTFELNCDGGLLAANQTYILRLEAPTSPAGTYSWLDRNGNPYPRGQGFALARDYIFREWGCC